MGYIYTKVSVPLLSFPSFCSYLGPFLWFCERISEYLFAAHIFCNVSWFIDLRSLPLVLEKIFVLHHGHVKKRKTKISFQHYVHDAMSMKKFVYIRFHKKLINATTSTTARSWQKSIYFHFGTTTFTTTWRKKITFFPYC